MEREYTPRQLEAIAARVRQSIVRSLEAAGSGHAAGPLGLSDIMTALYFAILRVRPDEPEWAERDLFVLSNGHCVPVLYAVMAERGFFDKEELLTLRTFGSRLQGHPERTSLPGLETTSGPLGCGLSQATGMAYQLQYLEPQPHRFVYCMMGDGELNEGNIWEAAMFAKKYNLSNLIAIVDRNNIQIGGDTEKVMPLGDLADKWRSFGWDAQEIDGHDHLAIIRAIDKAKNSRQPSVIIAHTIPGRGVDFMEYDYRWHGKSPNADQANQALSQLSEGNGE